MKINLSKNRNILLLTPFMDTGGTEKIIFDLAKGLISNRWSVFIISSGGRLVREIEDLGVVHIKLTSMSSKSPWNIYKSSREICNVIKKYKIRIVNSHSYVAALAVALSHSVFKKKYTHIFTLHIPEKEYYFFIMGLTLNWLVDKTCTVCQWTKNRLIRSGVSENKIKVIHNGVDFNYFNCNITKKLDSHNIKIGVIARLVKRKGHAVLLHAIKSFLNHDNSTNLQIFFYGDGPNKKVLEQLTKTLNLEKIVHFKGDTKDIRVAYRNIDLFILPSFYEGLPLTILESMCASVPVIVTNINGIPEVVINNITGITFSPGDHISLSKIMRKVIKNTKLRKKLAYNAHLWVRQNLDIDIMISKYEELFQISLINEK